jgi:hypothetical protein
VSTTIPSRLEEPVDQDGGAGVARSEPGERAQRRVGWSTKDVVRSAIAGRPLLGEGTSRVVRRTGVSCLRMAADRLGASGFHSSVSEC